MIKTNLSNSYICFDEITVTTGKKLKFGVKILTSKHIFPMMF